MLFAGFSSLLVYGGWALFANWEVGLKAALTAGGVQGLTSFTSGLVSASLIEGLFKVASPTIYKMGILSMLTLVSLYHIGGHLLAGTQNLWLTVAPALIVGNAYNIVYAFIVSRDGKPSDETN